MPDLEPQRPPSDPVAQAFLAFSAQRLRKLQQDIAACCDRLTGEQMLFRTGDHDNSITNLLLHLAGNLRQWVLHGMRGDPDVRTRDAEFALAPTESPAQARRLFDATLEEAAATIAALDPSRLLEVIDPQPNGTLRHPSILAAIYKIVGHVEYHAGQIVMATKRLAATDVDLSIPRAR